MKIEQLSLIPLHNEEHLQYITEFKDLAEKTTPETLGIRILWPAFLSRYDDEFRAMALVRKSSITSDLIAADLHRGDVFTGLHRIVHADLLHYDQAVRQAGQRLQVVFDHYGEVRGKSYDKETADIVSLISDLRTNHADDLLSLGLNEWLAELENSNNAFNNLIKNRYSEDSVKTQRRMREVRLDVDESYRGIIELINARIILQGDTDFLGFVNEMNTRIQHYRNVVARHKGRNVAAQKQGETEK